VRRSRRLITVIAVVLGTVAVFAPSVVAHRYADGPGGTDGVLGRPDKGWEFLIDAVTQSRDARLGSSTSAGERAREVWAGGSVRAESVRLTWMDGPFTVPVPGGGTPPAAGNAVATPRSSLGWTVIGRVRGGDRQMIGLLDYRSGRVVWNMRRGLGGPPR
jgi:hypothetical protein